MMHGQQNVRTLPTFVLTVVKSDSLISWNVQGLSRPASPFTLEYITDLSEVLLHQMM
jgi:hypothetical protein